MRYVLYSCGDHLTPLDRLPYDGDAPARCLALEVERNDGYAVYAMDGGRIVADADGWIERDTSPADPMLAAMERRWDGAE